MGSRSKESSTQENDKDTVEHLLRGANQRSVTARQVQDHDDDYKPRLLWGIRRDAVLCTLATLILAMLLLVIFIFMLVVRTTPTEEEIQFLNNNQQIIAVTRCGRLSGLSVDGAYSFLGIPYAESPTGIHRFKKPVPMTKLTSCWTGTYHAHRQKPSCYQPPIPGIDDVNFSEDCLYLDVHTPDVTYKNPLPVVVYFRGESILGHDKNSIKLQPTPKLARDTNMVYVTVTYRVHAFGFMSLRLLRNKGHSKSSGNYGMHDMLTALEWVRDNIDVFGGNQRDITVLGHGFTASAILSLVMSPLSKGLFNKAWMSGGATEVTNESLVKAEENNAEFLENIQCNSLNCLLYASAQEIVEATPWLDVLDLPFKREQDLAVIVVDGEIVTETHMKSMRRHRFNDVSCIFGATNYGVGNWKHLDEMNWTHVIDRVRVRLETIDDVLFNDAIAKYLLKNEPVSLQYSKMIADVRVRCPIFQFARRAQSRFINDVFVYSSSFHDTSNSRLDIAAILGQLSQFVSPMTEEDVDYEEQMQSAFISYVRNNKLGLDEKVVDPPFYVNFKSNDVIIDNKPDVLCQLWFKYNIYPHYARHN